MRSSAVTNTIGTAPGSTPGPVSVERHHRHKFFDHSNRSVGVDSSKAVWFGSDGERCGADRPGQSGYPEAQKHPFSNIGEIPQSELGDR
jgi:hypothetical protein